VTGGDEQFLVFNYQNPIALRDNVRQSAAELALAVEVLAGVTIALDDCPGASAPDGVARFDTETLAVMGHSMGASIAPLAAAVEPRFDALLLSGAGGSFIENLLHKQKPLATKGLVEIILGTIGSGYALGEHDPMLSLVQWAGEPADVPPYALATPPRHVLMMQGIVDHYILPPIANATSLSYRLDLAGAALDAQSAELAPFTPLASLLDLTGRAAIALPASANGADGVTAVVVQQLEDGIEDGHEVVFQTEPPQRAYRCFLAGLAEGVPVVPAPADADAPCD
jgi:pimeloyl-ACP methyl ester carboxylesterase